MLTCTPCRSRAVRAGYACRPPAYRTCPRPRAACPEGHPYQPGAYRTHSSVPWHPRPASCGHQWQDLPPRILRRRRLRNDLRAHPGAPPRTRPAPAPLHIPEPRTRPACTGTAPALHPPRLHQLCTRSAPALHLPRVRSALAPYPPRFPLPGAGPSGCDAQQHVPPRPGLRRRARPHRRSLDARRVRPRQPSRRQRRLVKVPALSAAPGPDDRAT